MNLETWFSGGGLADIGFQQAGLKPTRAIEIDPDIAEVYRANLGNHIKVGGVTDYANEMDDFVPDWFHASPPCQSASIANPDRGETETDIAMAHAIVKGLARKPQFFTLENVAQYKSFFSFELITEALRDRGYSFDFWGLNCADYGVPQCRHRLILIARLDGKSVRRPFPTHAKCPDLFCERWVAWYDAIKDLKLTRSKLAAWQLDRITRKLGGIPADLLVDGKGNSSGQLITVVPKKHPSFTMIANSGSKQVLRCLIDGQCYRLGTKAVARLQAVPDWYNVPDSPLGFKVLGNGVPPLLVRKIVESQINYPTA